MSRYYQLLKLRVVFVIYIFDVYRNMQYALEINYYNTFEK